jgi:hypothetical protein
MVMKKYEVHVQNTKNGPIEHDYDLVEREGVVMLSHSNNTSWSEHARGQMVGSLIDDGNEIIITLDDKKKPIKLDYKQAAELQMLLLANSSSEYITQIRESKTVMSYTGLGA